MLMFKARFSEHQTELPNWQTASKKRIGYPNPFFYFCLLCSATDSYFFGVKVKMACTL